MDGDDLVRELGYALLAVRAVHRMCEHLKRVDASGQHGGLDTSTWNELYS